MTIANLARPAFKAGSQYIQTKQAQNIDNINKRSGLGNREIVRPSFDSPPIQARQPIEFDRLQALDIENFGAKVQLGQEQLDQITMVSVPDPLDTKWLAEEARMIAVYQANGLTPDQITQELEINKPLGRHQRTISKPSKNIARESALSVKSKLDEIKQEIADGRAEGVAERAALVAQIATILQNLDLVARLSARELTNINASLMRLKIPKDYRAVFPGKRIIAGNDPYFIENKGVIAMFLMSNIPPDRTPNQPLLSWNTRDQKYYPAALLQIYQMKGIRFLDMEMRTIETARSLRDKGLAPPIIGGPVIQLGMPGGPDFDLFA